jgi:hypothetical protein
MSHELGVEDEITQSLRRLDYGLFDLDVLIRFLPGPREFSLFQNMLAGFGANLASYSVRTRSSVPVIKRSGRETDCSAIHLSNVEINNTWK